jgi:hypothetical protein
MGWGGHRKEKGATFSDALPDSEVPVSVEKREGRGHVELIQTPDSGNDYTAIIKIEDTKGGSDDYDIELRWPRLQRPRRERHVAPLVDHERPQELDHDRAILVEAGRSDAHDADVRP